MLAFFTVVKLSLLRYIYLLIYAQQFSGDAPNDAVGDINVKKNSVYAIDNRINGSSVHGELVYE